MARRLGYDPNPRGLAGTNPNKHSLAGTHSASDYKRDKAEKERKKKEKDKPSPPFPTEPPAAPRTDPVTIEPVVRPGEQGEDKPESGSSNDAWNLEWVQGGTSTPLSLPHPGTTDVLFHIMDVSDKFPIKLPTSPLENGMVKHDHKVRMPKTVRVSGQVEREYAHYFDALLEDARNSYNLDEYFTLSNSMTFYPVLYLQNVTHKASSAKYDVFEYTLNFSEIMIASDLRDTTSTPDWATQTNKGTTQGGGS